METIGLGDVVEKFTKATGIKKLADKMIWFIDNKHQIQSMGKASREIVESKFDVRKVNEEMLKILGIE